MAKIYFMRGNTKIHIEVEGTAQQVISKARRIKALGYTGIVIQIIGGVK